MKKFKTIGVVFILSCFLNGCNSASETKLDFVHQEELSARVVKQIGGSTGHDNIIFNTDRTLSCKLKSWKLIGVFNGNNLSTTEGEFVFEITNLDSKSHKWILFELLILDEEGNVQITSNPFRDLQGEILNISPPIDPEKSTLLSRVWKYRNGWDKVTLKSCQWVKSPDDYWEKYPELKDYPAP